MACDGVIATEDIPFGIIIQSLSGFCPTSGIPDHPDMDIVRNNIRHLMNLRGLNELTLASAAGIYQSWLTRYMKAKIAKPNMEKLSAVANALGVSLNQLMFSDLTQPGAVPPSQPTQLEKETIAAAVKLVKELEDVSPVRQDPSTFSDRLAVAGKTVDRFGHDGILDGSKLNEALRHFAAELRRAG